MLVATIAAKDYESASLILAKAQSYPIDAIELRLDYLYRIDLEVVRKIANSFSGPKIFTLRKKSQGGYFTGGEQERLQFIEQMATLSPDYFDLSLFI